MGNRSDSVTLVKERVEEAKKIIAQKRNIKRVTNDLLAKLMFYENPQTVGTNIKHGRPIPKDRCAKLIEESGLRLNYLTGEDDYRTDEDLAKGFKMQHNEEFRIALKHLDSLSMHLELCPCICCSIDELRANNTYEPYFYYPEEVKKQLNNRNAEGNIKKVFRLKTIALTNIEHINNHSVFSLNLDSLIERYNKDIAKGIKINDEVLIRETGITLYYEVSKRESISNKPVVIGYVSATKIGSLVELLDSMYLKAAESIFTSDLINL